MDMSDVWAKFVALAAELRGELFSFAVTSFVYIFNRIVYGPAKLKWAVEHEHHYSIPVYEEGVFKQVIQIDTVAIFIQNTGRSAADDIDVIFNYDPVNYDLVPPRKFDIHSNPDGRFVITFERLQSKEYISIRLIGVKPGEIPYILSVTHRNGSGKRVSMGPQEILSRKYLVVLQFIFYVGVFACSYLSVEILRVIL